MGGSASKVIATLNSSDTSGPRIVATANVDHIVILNQNAEFRRAYWAAAARTLDGMPLVWLARLLGDRQATRITGHDLLEATILVDPPHDLRVFIVCASKSVGEAVTQRLTSQGLAADQIAFAVPPFGFEHDADYSAMLAARIRAHKTRLLIMGVGAPKSEIWTYQQGAALGSPIVLNVGDAVTVAAGLLPRAPPLMQRLGLEWLFRFALDPRRLFRRYFLRSWQFLYLALKGVDLGPVIDRTPAGSGRPRIEA